MNAKDDLLLKITCLDFTKLQKAVRILIHTYIYTCPAYTAKFVRITELCLRKIITTGLGPNVERNVCIWGPQRWYGMKVRQCHEGHTLMRVNTIITSLAKLVYAKIKINNLCISACCRAQDRCTWKQLLKTGALLAGTCWWWWWQWYPDLLRSTLQTFSAKDWKCPAGRPSTMWLRTVE